jgi:nucleotide-binding universal stress UspA family protein
MTTSPFKTILVPVDFDETSTRALDHAIDLAAKLGASIKVMHARPMPVAELTDGAIFPSAEQAAQLADDAQRRLDALVAARRDRGVPLSTLLRSGDPRDEIPAVANELGVDLVVMGTHGRGPIARALLGSVAPSALRAVVQPVLMVPALR